VRSFSRLNGSAHMGTYTGVNSCLSELDLLTMAASGIAVGASGGGSNHHLT
jgi:hypothetical protein